MPPQPYRRPAWPGLVPARPIYAPAHPEISAAIARALEIDAPVFQLTNAGGASATFRVDDDQPLFVKLVDADRWIQLREAEMIARWLVSQDAPAIAALESQPPTLESGEFVVVYPFADGRPPAATVEDAQAIGAGIARIHSALTRHPHVAAWQASTDQRIERLNGVRKQLASGELIAGPRPDELRELAADRSISFLPGAHRSGPPRPLHGDLNIFNIVMEKGGARFIDFEDVVHSVLPPENDLVLVCERVVLVQTADDAAAAAAIDALLDAYSKAGGDPINRAALPDVLRGLSLRSLCTLAEIDRSGHDAEEWKKFFTLIEAAHRRRGVFA